MSTILKTTDRPSLEVGRADPAVAGACINTIRALAMDAVEQANSGHPGTPMALAPAAFVLWTRFLRHNPKNPAWPDREPIGHLAALRAIPNLVVLRPADATETVDAWQVALERKTGPVVLALTRQKVPVLDREKLAPAAGVRRGAYVLADPLQGAPEVILVATGSEVHLALAAWERLRERAVPARVVSMPSWELFEAQPREYRESVLPPTIRARVAVEAGSSFAWLRYVTEAGEVVGIDRFGASAPGEVLFREFGFTVERVLASVDRVLRNTRGP